MQDNHTISGSQSPGVEEPTVVEQVLNEAARELPPITLAGCLTVVAEVLPYSVRLLRPICTRRGASGEHSIPSQFVWKDLETNEVFCHLVCAAREAIDKAGQIAIEEIYPVGARRG